MTVLEQAQAAFPELAWQDDDDPEHFASADLYYGCSMQLEYFAGYATGPEVQAVVVCGDYGDMQEFATVPEALAYLRAELTKMRDRLNVALGEHQPIVCRHCGTEVKLVTGQRWQWIATSPKTSAIYCKSHHNGDGYHEV